MITCKQCRCLFIPTANRKVFCSYSCSRHHKCEDSDSKHRKAKYVTEKKKTSLELLTRKNTDREIEMINNFLKKDKK